MFPWFQLLILWIIWKAFEDFWMEQLGDAEDVIVEKLKELTPGEQLGTSPLVKVLAVDEAADTVTILVRGPIKLSSAVTPFMRVEVVISRSDVHLTGDGPPIRIKEWRTVIGDLAINRDKGSGEKPVTGSSSSVIEGSLGFGYEHDAWLGEGSLKLGVAPMRLGAAIYGGISDRGMVLGLDAEFPRAGAIPLGPTGLGLRGFGGDFAYNFVPRLENAGIPIVSPTAFDYVTWARDRTSIDRWKAGPIDKTAVGIGVRTVLCTMVDQGYVFELNPVGFAFLTPGGAFILGGKGVLLRQKSFGVESYFVVDFGSASLAFGAGVNIEIKGPPEELLGGLSVTILKGSGQLDVFFSFSNPTAWFFDFGREDTPVSLEVLTDVPIISIIFSEKAEAYLRINHHRIAFGAGLSIGGTFKLKDILELSARLAASLHAYMGRDPLLIRGKLDVIGELKFKAFDTFEFILTGRASVMVYVPTPVLFRFELYYKLDLPWPLPDIEDKKSFGDDEIIAPEISSPLLAGSFTVGGATGTHPQKITASHTVSERQWMPEADKLWPDLELVVPFSRRVADKTGTVTVFAQVISVSSEPGSYEVKEAITKLEILDLIHNTVVPDVKAVWVDGPDGSTALLRVLGTDPFSWLTAQTSAAAVAVSTPPKVRDLFFGVGPPETFTAPRRFDDVIVRSPAGPAELRVDFAPSLTTRVLRVREVLFRFTSGGEDVAVDQVVLFLLGFSPRDRLLVDGQPLAIDFSDGGAVVGDVRIVVAAFTLPQPRTHIAIRTQLGADLLIHAVRYREAPATSGFTLKKKLLVPGRYRLTVEGKSTAEHPEFSSHPELYPSAAPIDWRATQDFEVVYPESLHPYIYYSTFGDNRRFSRDQHPWTTWTADTWDPAQFGFGLPLYRKYQLVVRFLVPYVSTIFSDVPLKMRVAYDAGPELVQSVTPTAVPDGSSSMLPESQTWINAMGGTVAPDQEVVFPLYLPNAGTARLTIFFNHPAGGEVAIEDWTGIVSRFASFSEHLSWDGTCLTTYYDAKGRHVHPACDALGGAPPAGPPFAAIFAEGVEPLVSASGPLKPKPQGRPRGPLLADALDLGQAVPFPPELAVPPLDWLLPPALAGHLGPLDLSAGLRYGRFAADSKVSFSDGGNDPLRGITDMVPATTIEAVTDAEGRPYALWIRTPEPVDWRRVTTALTIRHVEPATDCPTRFAHRTPLEPAVTVLPSPDGSSAFLVASYTGPAICLPRGEYTLTLRFNPTKAGLPPLRPSVMIGGSEVVTLRFLQPFGKPWPERRDGLYVPHHLVAVALRNLKFPPEWWTEAYQKNLPEEELERRIDAFLKSAAADEEKS